MRSPNITWLAHNIPIMLRVKLWIGMPMIEGIVCSLGALLSIGTVYPETNGIRWRTSIWTSATMACVEKNDLLSYQITFISKFTFHLKQKITIFLKKILWLEFFAFFTFWYKYHIFYQYSFRSNIKQTHILQSIIIQTFLLKHHIFNSAVFSPETVKRWRKK